MKNQDIIGLWEAYQQVHTQEEVEQLDEGMTLPDYKKKRSALKQKEKRAAAATAPTRRAGIHTPDHAPERAARHRFNVDPDFEGNDEENYPGGRLRPNKVRKAKALGELGEGVDLFDYLLEYLVAEGYADTNKAALAIMANMSEEWKQSILNEDPVQDYRDMQRAKRDRPLSRDDSGLTDYGAGGGAAAEAKGIPRAAVIKQGAINRANLEKNNKPEKPGPSNNFGRGF